MTVSIFDPEASQKKYEFWMRTAPPSKAYSILFTPRSGSSWLTSILTQTKAMGTPSEWFNPELMPSSSRAKGARNLDQFVGPSAATTSMATSSGSRSPTTSFAPSSGVIRISWRISRIRYSSG